VGLFVLGGWGGVSSDMHPKMTALERAFQLARSGKVEGVSEIRKVLDREGYSADQLQGSTLKPQLSGLIAEVGRVRGAAATAAKAKIFAERMRPIFSELAGLSASAAARELEQRGYATTRGGKWSPLLVIRTRARLEAAP
jgi:hypothetical protein